jgi:hypothetical protein
MRVRFWTLNGGAVWTAPGAPVTAFRSSNGRRFQKRRRYAYGGLSTHPASDLIGDWTTPVAPCVRTPCME